MPCSGIWASTGLVLQVYFTKNTIINKTKIKAIDATLLKDDYILC